MLQQSCKACDVQGPVITLVPTAGDVSSEKMSVCQSLLPCFNPYMEVRGASYG